MDYREFPPHPLLRPYVRTYWSLRGRSADAEPQPVMPDGTTEIIVHRGRPFWRYCADGAGERQAALLFAGQMQAPAIIQPDGEADVVAIRLAPLGAFVLLGIPQSEMRNHIADAESLGRPWLAAAMRRARSADTPVLALRQLETALLARLDGTRVTPQALRAVRTVVTAINRASGAVSIEHAAQRAGISRRHLERWFDTAVGLSPKAYARVIRFQSAALRIADEPATGLLDVSMGSGYFDQSHMIRDFVQLAGRSPAEFRHRLSGLTSAMLSRDT